MVPVREIMTPEEKILYYAIGLTLLALILSCHPAYAGFTATEYIYSTGGACINNDQQWSDGDRLTQVWRPSDGNLNEGAAGQQIVTGPGMSEVEVKAELTSKYQQSTTLTYTGGGAAWDSLHTNNLVPNESELACTASEIVYYGDGTTTNGATPNHQSATGQIGMQGPTGRYEVTKYLDGSTYALSGKMQGTGMIHGDLFAKAESGTDKNSNTKNYENSVRRHVFGASNDTGVVGGFIDWTWTDFSDPFNITAHEEVNTTSEEA